MKLAIRCAIRCVGYPLSGLPFLVENRGGGLSIVLSVVLLGGLLGSPGDFSGPRARNVRSGPPSGPALGAVLEASWAILEASRALLGPSGAVSGRSWKPLGPCWGDLGGMLGRLGAPVGRKGENAKIFQTQSEQTVVFACRGPLGRPLESILDLGGSRGHLGLS